MSIPTLLDFAEWLNYEIQVQEDTTRFVTSQRRAPSMHIRDSKQAPKSTTIFLGTEEAVSKSAPPVPTSKDTLRPYCPYCDDSKHSLNNCSNFKNLTKTNFKKAKSEAGSRITTDAGAAEEAISQQNVI